MIQNNLRNERGMALAVVMVVLLMLGVVGIASIETSSVDMDISKAMTNKVKSFYMADGGLELAVTRMQANADIMDLDTVLKLVNQDSALGLGHFKIQFANAYPVITVISEGHEDDGSSAVAMNVKHRRNAFNPWNNAIFAGVGQTGKGIAGNVDIHGSVHVLGEGEPFTDNNGNGDWDDADTYMDLNGDGAWTPGEPLTTDTDGDGVWDPAEPFVDENGSGLYDQTLTATDLSFEASGSAAIKNNYSGLSATIASRVPPIPTVNYNGENVYSLSAELRVKHGRVNLSGTANVGDPDAPGGSPLEKETMDAVFVNDGFGGSGGTGNVYSDNGTSESYDLPDGMASFPSLNDPLYTYTDHRDYYAGNALIIPGDLTLTPGTSYSSPASAKGSISLDNNGRLRISGMVYIGGNLSIDAGHGPKLHTPIEYEGRGTLAAKGNININTHVIARSDYPATNSIGFVANNDLVIGGGPGAAQLDLMGAFFAQNRIESHKQNDLAGAMVSNFFEISEVPSIYHVPTLAENLPPGMPGGNRYSAFYWKRLNWTWHEL